MAKGPVPAPARQRDPISSSEGSPIGVPLPISLSITGDTTDISVPLNVALAELMPTIVKALRPLGSRTATRGLTIRILDGRALNQLESLPDQRIRPGVVFTVESSGTNVKDWRYDDLVEAVETAMVKNSVSQGKINSVRFSAHISTALVLLAALPLVTGSREPVLTTTVGVCGATLTTLAAAAVARTPSRPGAPSPGRTTSVLISCIAFAVTLEHWLPLLLVAADIGLPVGSVIPLVLPSDLRVSMTAPMTAGASSTLVGGPVGMMDIPPDGVAVTTLVLLVVIAFSALWVAMAQLPTVIGISRENERIDPVWAYSRVGDARVLVIPLKAGCSTAMMVLIPLMATPPMMITVLACVGLALMSATRSLRSPVEVAIGVLTGMLPTIVAAVTIATVIPDALPWTLDAIIPTTTPLLMADVVSQRLYPWLTRLAGAAGALVLLGILPLAVLVRGVA